MKWMTVVSLFFLLTACGFNNTDVVEYRQVIVTPLDERLTIVDVEPVDVTATTINYY